MVLSKNYPSYSDDPTTRSKSTGSKGMPYYKLSDSNNHEKIKLENEMKLNYMRKKNTKESRVCEKGMNSRLRRLRVQRTTQCFAVGIVSVIFICTGFGGEKGSRGFGVEKE